MLKNLTKNLILVSLLVLAGTVSAHQPNYVNDKTWVGITEPEVSKAYYGVLPEKSVKYVISSETSFPLYVGLLVPDLPEIQKNISAVVIRQDGTVVANLAGKKFEWVRWYEEFAGDWYWQGPEFKKNVPAGTYTIIVSSPANNWDKYVLATGEVEVFPITKYPAMQKQLYAIKTEFFDKPWYSIFEGKIGRYQLVVVILILVLVFLGSWLKRKLYKRN